VRSEAPVNCFLLCTVVAKQTRHLARLMPDRQTPELIIIALKNCAQHDLELDVDAGAPEIVRQQATQIGQLTRHLEPGVASRELSERSQIADAVLVTDGQDMAEGGVADQPSILSYGAIDTHLSVGSRIDSLDSHRNLHGVQRKHSMNNDGMDPIRLRQLRAIAENLCTQANRHRDNKNYLVAYALYGRALSVAQEIRTPEHDTDSLGTRIRTDQQAVFEMLCSVENCLEKSPLEKAQKVGR
jgi:hypothetical protein